MIRGLARYEHLEHTCVITEHALHHALFGRDACAEAVIARAGADAVGFAVFFHHFSTFLGRRGLWLEDLFVRPEHRGKGYGRALLAPVASVAAHRQCGRLQWAVLDWNESAIAFYQGLGASVLPDWRIVRVTDDRLAALAGGGMPPQ